MITLERCHASYDAFFAWAACGPPGDRPGGDRRNVIPRACDRAGRCGRSGDGTDQCGIRRGKGDRDANGCRAHRAHGVRFGHRLSLSERTPPCRPDRPRDGSDAGTAHPLRLHADGDQPPSLVVARRQWTGGGRCRCISDGRPYGLGRDDAGKACRRVDSDPAADQRNSGAALARGTVAVCRRRLASVGGDGILSVACNVRTRFRRNDRRSREPGQSQWRTTPSRCPTTSLAGCRYQ